MNDDKLPDLKDLGRHARTGQRRLKYLGELIRRNEGDPDHAGPLAYNKAEAASWRFHLALAAYVSETCGREENFNK